MILVGLIKNSFVDYRGKVAAVIFTPGCNFNCYYCHNRELINVKDSPEPLSEEEVFAFLTKRVDSLDGVVITGGEPTLQKGLPEFIKKLKKLGYPVKLDTNGTNPILLSKLLDQKLLDYVAMDIKAPFDRYFELSGVDFPIETIKESIKIIMESGIDYEFRTTVTPDLEIEDLISIANSIKTAKRYVLQKYKPQDKFKNLIDLRSKQEPHKPSFFDAAKIELEKIIPSIEIK